MNAMSSQQMKNSINQPEQIFFSAGEPSGDIHAAALIKELKSKSPQIQCVGFGGPRMQEAGLELHYDMTQKAIMFLSRAIMGLWSFYKLYSRAKRYFAKNKESIKAVVLVDYPGFNWWVARAAKKYGIPVFYLMPPQLWAWGAWRIKKMQRLVDIVFTTMPFETSWYKNHNCNVISIGHPFLEEAKHHEIDEQFVSELRQDDKPILTILPGSRDQEIRMNFDDLISAVIHLRQVKPNVRPMIAAFSNKHAEIINEKLAQRNQTIPVYVDRTQELIRVAHFALAVSGSVTLELMTQHIPTVVYYRVSKFAHLAQRFLRRSRFITLVNLLAVDQLATGCIRYPHKVWPIPGAPDRHDVEEMVFPEFLTPDDRSEEVAEYFIEWLDYEREYQLIKDQLKHLHQKLDPKESPFALAAEALGKNFQQLKIAHSLENGEELDENEEVEETSNQEFLEASDAHVYYTAAQTAVPTPGHHFSDNHSVSVQNEVER